MDSQYQGMAALGLEHRVVRAVVCYVFLRVKNRNRSVGNRKQCGRVVLVSREAHPTHSHLQIPVASMASKSDRSDSFGCVRPC